MPGAAGEYDLCVRALDAAGEPVPPGPPAAGLRVSCGAVGVPAALQLPGGPGTSLEPSVGGGPAGGPSINDLSRRRGPVPPAAGFDPDAGVDINDGFDPDAPLPRDFRSVPSLAPPAPAGPAAPLAAPAPLPTSLPADFGLSDAPGPPADAPLPRSYRDVPNAPPADAPAATGGADGFHAEALLGAARNAVARGELGEAARRFEEYLRERPGDTAVRAEAAGVLVTAGRTAEAAAAFETLIAADPRDPAALAGYANLLIGLGNYATARENLLAVLAVTAPPTGARYLAEDPERAERRWDAAVALVRTYLLEGRPAEAQHAAAAHLAGGPPPGAEPRLKYARLLMELGRPGDALAVLDALRREFPQDPRPVADSLLAHVRLLDAAGAQNAAAALGGMPVSDAGLWLGLGEELYRDDALREARRVLGQLVSAHPDDDAAAVLLARAQSRLLEFSSARAGFEALEPKLAGEPRFEAAYTEYLILAGEWADAAARAKVRLRDRPADAAALRDLGDVLHASGQYLRAEGQYAKVVALLPEAPEPVFLRAKNLALRRNFDLAINMLDSLRARRPGDVRVTLQLAAVLVKRGAAADLARAQAELTRPPAAPRTPRQEAALRIKLAEVLIDRRRPSEALRELERLPPMAAREPAAVYLTSRALAALGRFDAAEKALHATGSPLSPVAGDAYTLLTVASLAVEDCECCLAQELAGRVTQFAPDHPLALNLRAEAMLLCRPTGGLIPNCGTGSCCGGGCGGDCPDGGVFCGLFGGIEPATSEGCGEPVCGGKCGVCPPPPSPRGPCRDCVAGAPCDGAGGCGAGCGGKVEHRGAAGVFAQTLMHRPRNSRAQLGYARGGGGDAEVLGRERRLPAVPRRAARRRQRRPRTGPARRRLEGLRRRGLPLHRGRRRREPGRGRGGGHGRLLRRTRRRVRRTRARRAGPGRRVARRVRGQRPRRVGRAGAGRGISSPLPTRRDRLDRAARQAAPHAPPPRRRAAVPRPDRTGARQPGRPVRPRPDPANPRVHPRRRARIPRAARREPLPLAGPRGVGAAPPLAPAGGVRVVQFPEPRRPRPAGGLGHRGLHRRRPAHHRRHDGHHHRLLHAPRPGAVPAGRVPGPDSRGGRLAAVRPPAAGGTSAAGRG